MLLQTLCFQFSHIFAFLDPWIRNQYIKVNTLFVFIIIFMRWHFQLLAFEIENQSSSDQTELRNVIHKKFTAVMLFSVPRIQLCKTNSPHTPRHCEIILFALIHQPRKSSKLQSQWLFIHLYDNPDPTKANICLVFGLADSQLGIRKQQFPWSDVNLAQHVDFINHPVSSVNLIGR